MNKNETKTVYAYDSEGLYKGTHTLDYTDRSRVSGRWQIPANMTEKKALKEKEGYNIYFTGTKWEYREMPKEPEPVEEPTQEEDAEPSVDPIEELREQLLELQLAVAEIHEDVTAQSDEMQLALAEMFESIGSEG